VKKIYFPLFFLILLGVPTTFADELEITGVRVYVDGIREADVTNTGGRIDSNVFPGAEIRLTITIKNDYSRDDDVDIEDITIDATIEDIDLGADLTAEHDPFDLSAGKSESVTLVFKVPEQVKTGTYDMTLNVDAEADDGNTFDDVLTFEVKVIKQEHDVRLTAFEVSDSTPSCGDKITFTATVQNYGINKESVRLAVEQEELGANFASVFSVSEDIENPANKYVKSYPLTLADNVSGAIDIPATITYAVRFDDKKKVSIAVSCDEKTIVKLPVTPEVEVIPALPETPVLVTTPQVVNTTPIIIAPAPVVQEKSPYNFIAIILLTNLALLLIGTGILYLILKKPRKQTFEDLNFSDIDKKLNTMSAQQLLDDSGNPKKDKKLSYY
jgi:hypothetical protein